MNILKFPSEVESIPRLAKAIRAEVRRVEKLLTDHKAMQVSNEDLKPHLKAFMENSDALYRNLQGILREGGVLASLGLRSKDIDQARDDMIDQLPARLHGAFAAGHDLVSLQAVLLGARQKVLAIERFTKRGRGARIKLLECNLYESISGWLSDVRISKEAAGATVDAIFHHLGLDRPTAPTLKANRARATRNS